MATRVTPYDKNADSSSGTTLQSNALSVQDGDQICVGVRWEDGAAVTSVTDNKGNTYAARPQVVHANGYCLQVFYANANGTYADLLVTATHAVARPWRQVMCAFARASGGTPLAFDNGAPNTGSGTAIATGSYAVSGNGGIAFTFVGPSDAATYTVGSGWTEQFDDGAYMEDRLLNGSEGTIVGQATSSISMDWTAYSIAFKEAGISSPGDASGGIATGTASAPAGSASSTRSVTITLKNSAGAPLVGISRRFWTRNALHDAAADGGAGGLAVTCDSSGNFVLTGLAVLAGAGWLTYKDPSDDLNCHTVPVTFV